MTEFAIDVRGVRKSYGDSVVLDGVDLRVRRGSVFALLGPNGAGKTTLINILSTLTRLDGGEAFVAGCDVSADPDGVREAICVTGQYAAVDAVLTGEENLRMLARLSGFGAAAAAERARELLAAFDLGDAAGKRVKDYSGGMQRRLDIALGLVAWPPVIFLDEPTTGLDTRSRQALWAMILDLAAAGTTVLLTTQYLEEADALAERIAVLDNGRIVAEGTPAQLKSRVGGDVVELRSADDTVIREAPTDGTLAGLRVVLDALSAEGVPVGTSVVVRKPSMDDVFLALTGHSTTEEEIAA
ncbi:ATP-binding cassette domain-containing protein [Rathayibacter sp. YIM 133350]|uniref:ATP-binding cassette domain-containing protein n=1 Tax=Rathayibacter sp. YIM 133350 TaxID=3131992 RepID=UPI00307ED1AB